MRVKAPPIEHQTITFYPSYPARFKYSSYWVCDVTGDKVKLSAGLKEYYMYRLYRYEFMTDKKLDYNESHQRVADTLGVGVDTIKKNYQPLLVRMGLIETKNINTSDMRYIVNTISNLNGWLCNDKLSKYDEVSYRQDDKGDKKKVFDYQNYKVLLHNQSQAKRLKSNSDIKCHIIPSDRLHELIKMEHELKQLKENNTNES